MPRETTESHRTKEGKTPEPTAVRDLVGFVLLSIAAFVAVSLATYHPLDPSLNTEVRGEGMRVHNVGGMIGSYLADFLLQLFGYAGYAVPVGVLAVAYMVVFRPFWSGAWGRLFGFLAFIFSISLSLELLSKNRGSSAAWGGGVGYVSEHLLSHYFGGIGTALVAFTTLTIALVLTVGLRIQQCWRGARRTARGVHKLGRVTASLLKPIGRGAKRLLEFGERELERSVEEIRRESAPHIPMRDTEIGGDEKEPRVGNSLSGVPEIPIVFPAEKKSLGAMPQFHTGDEEPATEAKTKKSRTESFKLPDVGLLEAPAERELAVDRNELFLNAQTLERKVKDFGVFGKVVEVQPGPVVTMYEYEPAPGIKVNQLTRLNDDLALALKAMSVRIEPIPGKSVIGIEVANRNRQVVYLKELLANEIFHKSSSRLTIALGKDISGSPVVADLRRMPHLLVAGATGSGKSVAVNSMILSILYKATPEEVRMILVDPKMLELSFYDGIPHLLLPVVTDPRKSAAALRWAVIEMERRYRLMADIGVRNIEGYNKKVAKFMEDPKAANYERPKEEELLLPEGTPSTGSDHEKHTGTIPYIVIVIDELADLMMVSSREVEESIIRLAQMARAAGIHLLLATQRPSVDVITGVIKANMPARISFKVASKTDSRTILDANGAELLLGAGDMLFLPPGTSRLQRIHSAFVTDNEVKRVTDFWKEQGSPEYHPEILKVQEEETLLISGEGEDAEMYGKALEVVRTHRIASISLIQRKLRIGYNRAARLVERMEEEGLLAPGEIGKPREVIMSRFDAL